MIKKIRDQLLGDSKSDASGITDNSLQGKGQVTSDTRVILDKQIMRASYIVLGLLVTGFIVFKLLSNGRIKSAKNEVEETQIQGKTNIEVGSKSLDPEIMWRNHFEDKLIDSTNKMATKLEVIEQSFVKKEEELESNTQRELAGMNVQLKLAKEELVSALNELRAVREEMNEKPAVKATPLKAVHISSRLIDDERNIDTPKSSRNFIPETTYVKGVMVSGLSVSTAVSSSMEPVPVLIQIVDKGNLPNNFELDMKHCRILGSAYGDISSERAIIRAETLSCEEAELGEIITTRIAGAIFGDDGMNGIKGKVIRTSNKHVQHALVGGLLSGFSSIAKSPEQFTLTGAGAINNKTSGLQDRLKDGGIGGLGNAGEKIADYYLKQAESMSPVLQIPGGIKVDIFFTKGVYVGSGDVREKIASSRQSQDGGQNHE